MDLGTENEIGRGEDKREILKTILNKKKRRERKKNI